MEWRFGVTPAFNVSLETRLDFGCLELLLNVKNGTIASATCYTDAMDDTLAERVQTTLNGCVYGKLPLSERLRLGGNAEMNALADWIEQQTF